MSDIMEEIEREARYPRLLEIEAEQSNLTKLMAKALHTGEPVWIGLIFGEDVWVTTNGVQKDNAMGT